MKDAKLAEQLRNFSNEMSEVFHQGALQSTPHSWADAFTELRKAIEKIPEDRKVILFFDELPWLASRKSNFLQVLDHTWNRHFSRRKNLIVIICGSAASWMIDNVINNKGGLYLRITQVIRLLPFDLSETEIFLKEKGLRLDQKQIIDIYMAIGGVATYLSLPEIEKGKSSAQIINDICFSQKGFLRTEFNLLYRSLFEGYKNHIKIVKCLAKSPYGLPKSDILKQTQLSSGGTTSKIFDDLLQSGFIMYIRNFGRSKAGGIYKLIDEYSHFYLKWVEAFDTIGLASSDPDYWKKKQNSQAWRSWSGRAFESVCLKHISAIKHALGISGVSTSEWCWSQDAQIDLVLDRQDQCINLCEIKYHSSEITVTQELADELNHKKEVFMKNTKTSKSLFTTLITTYGVKEKGHYLSAIDSQLTIKDLFQAVSRN